MKIKRSSYFGRSFFRSKKGDGLSMNVVIITILCLVVLVVLVIIFINGTNKSQKQLDSCLGGSTCVDSKSECCDENGGAGVLLESDCYKDDQQKGKYCCSVIGGTKKTCPTS